jgi:hypothetical protein
MREVIREKLKRDLGSNDTSVSVELNILYDIFRSLIKTKKFENNDYLGKEDALAVMDLAEACIIFLDDDEDAEPNYKSAGICFSNIGNI